MRARGRELARGRGENKDKTMGSGVIDLLCIWVDGGFSKRRKRSNFKNLKIKAHTTALD